jgi:hypothetical protein
MCTHTKNSEAVFTLVNHIAPDWFTASAHLVPREPGRPGTTISGICADAGKWPQNDLFCIHSCNHRSSRTDN